MIYLTQLIFVKEGKEEVLNEFENFAIPLMEKYGGKIIYRMRPEADSYVTANEPIPYEIHFISFNSEEDLAAFLKDDERQKFVHLKNESVESIFLVKGKRMT